MSTVSLVADARAALGEGPTWDPRTATLLWVDILAGELHRFDPATGADRVTARIEPPLAGAVVRRDGGLVCGAGMAIALLDEESGALSTLARVDRGDRLNELAADLAGRLWAGTLTDAHTPGASALYRLAPGADAVTVLDDVALSNGMGWSPDGATMYYVDTPREVVEAFDYDAETGAITGRRTFADLHDVPGRPDGLAVDEDGGVWVAMARGWAVRRFLADGRPDAVIDIPCFRVTSCGFGGPDLTDLYVTTARFGLDEDELARQPHAGGLFRHATGVRGLPAAEYAG